MLNWYQKIFSGYLILLFIYWVLLHLNHQTGGFYNMLYSFLFSLVPLIGGIIGMIGSHHWGFLKSAIGKGVFFVSFGIFLWGAGSMVWSYYNFFQNQPAPYPSLADIGFAPSIFFYGLGTFYLSKVTGAKFGLRNPIAKFFVVIAPIVVTIFAYYILVTVARGGAIIPAGDDWLKAIFDIAYPLGDFIGLMVAILVSGLSFRFMGGKYLMDIIAILIGLGVMFIGDAWFSYTTTVNSFYNGDLGDLILTVGLFLLSFGVLGFCKLRET